jgi:hypothetical protein
VEMGRIYRLDAKSASTSSSWGILRFTDIAD